jgi:hypothetical protein
VGVAIGWVAARHGSRRQGDLAMAIFVGCAPFQCLELPRRSLPAPTPQPTPHIALKLDAELLDACTGEYEIAPNNAFPPQVTIQRNGDHLVWHAFGRSAFQFASNLYPESETNFFLKNYDVQVTFIKNDKGEVTALIHHLAGLPDGEGKKLKSK